MGVSRISSTYMVDSGIANLQTNLSLMSKIQNLIASGQNISTPSDDPTGLSQLLNVTTQMNQDATYNNNINSGLGELGAAEVAVKGIVDISTRLRDLATQAANAVNGPDQLNAIKQEVDNLKSQLVSLGNSTFGGHYIFSGFLTSTSPFSTAGQDVTYNGTPSASSFQRTVQVAQNTFVPVNVNGDDLLGHVTVTAGVPSGQGLMYDVTKLSIDLQNQDYTSIRSDIDSIKTDQNSVLNLQTEIGGYTNQLQMTQTRINDRNVVESQQVAKIQQVDMPKVISDFNFQQNIYQASIGVMSKIMQTSLMNFLA